MSKQREGEGIIRLKEFQSWTNSESHLQTSLRTCKKKSHQKGDRSVRLAGTVEPPKLNMHKVIEWGKKMSEKLNKTCQNAK